MKTIFLTNTDSKRPITVLKNLHNLGFDRIRLEDIYTPLIALKEFLTKNTNKKSYLVVSKEAKEEFIEFPQIEERNSNEIPDFVIIGDFYDDWRIERLNKAFRYVLQGSQLLGTQGNLYYIDKNGSEKLDSGAFINIVGNSAKSTDTKIFGKPSKDYFNHALDKLNVSSNESIVIGDDFETDIKGANDSGIMSVLVRTGKSRLNLPDPMIYKPFKIIESIKELPSLLS